MHAQCSTAISLQIQGTDACGGPTVRKKYVNFTHCLDPGSHAWNLAILEYPLQWVEFLTLTLLPYGMRGYIAGARNHTTWDTAHGFSTCRNLYNRSLEMINAVIHWEVISKYCFATKFWRLPPKPLGFEPDDMQWPFQPKLLSLSIPLKCNIFTQINVSWKNMLEVRAL